MSRSQNQLDRVFLRSSYAVHYRRAPRIRWASEARSDYAALFLLEGKLLYDIGDHAGGEEVSARGALLLDPGVAASARGRDAEYLTLTLSPSYLLDCAV